MSGTDHWYSVVVPTVKTWLVMEPVAEVGLTGPGSEEGAAIADGDQVVVPVGQDPLVAGATWTEPGLLVVVAQFT